MQKRIIDYRKTAWVYFAETAAAVGKSRLQIDIMIGIEFQLGPDTQSTNSIGCGFDILKQTTPSTVPIRERKLARYWGRGRHGFGVLF